MKKGLQLVLSLFLSYPAAFAQQATIPETEVARVVQTLSSDEMQGRPALGPGNKKAATFIESEFKTIGLTPLAGLEGFQQSFRAYRVSQATMEVTLGVDPVSKDRMMAVSSQAQLQWKSDATIPISTVYIGPEDNFAQKAGGIMRSKVNTLVLVNPKHQEIFNKYKNYFSQGNISTEAGAADSYVFILSDLSQVPAYQVNITNTIDTITMNNVVGVLPGKSLKNEIVIFSGHYDHLGILQPVNGDSIANGADDDASGTTAVISLARYFKQLNNNARTLVFVAFTAEEIGGYGSKYFSQQMDPKQVVAMFNIEMIGKPSKFGPNTAWITGFNETNFGKTLQKNLKGSPYTFYADPYPDQNLFYRSDNATLARQGVPAHSISTDEIDIDKLYHSVDDEFSTLNMKHMTGVIRAIALSAQSIISGKATPTRVNTAGLK